MGIESVERLFESDSGFLLEILSTHQISSESAKTVRSFVAQDRNLMVPAPYPTHLDLCSLTLRVSEATSVGAKSQWGRCNSLGGG